VPGLITAYYAETSDPSVPVQRVAFGTSGHRGSSCDKSFNEQHILAISQAICLYRKEQQIDGPLFFGMNTHALSVPALSSALEVLAANGVEVMLAEGDEYTPTPPSRTRFSPTIADESAASLMASSSRPPTTRRMMAVSNTTRLTAGRPKPGSRAESKRKPANCWKPPLRV
jgi:phosphoglucomutase